MKVKHKSTLNDFEVVQTHIPRDKDEKWYVNKDYSSVPGYEVYKTNYMYIFFKIKINFMPILEIRREKLEDVAKWLSIETGDNVDNILKSLEKNESKEK